MKKPLFVHLFIMLSIVLGLAHVGYFDGLVGAKLIRNLRIAAEETLDNAPANFFSDIWSTNDLNEQSRIAEEEISRAQAFAQVTKDAADKKMKPTHVALLLKAVGFPEEAVPRMVCTALYESAFKTNATNRNSNGSQDTGLFQINDLWERECGVSRQALKDPVVNAKCALRVFEVHGYWAWYAYRKNQEQCKNFQLSNKKYSVALN